MAMWWMLTCFLMFQLTSALNSSWPDSPLLGGMWPPTRSGRRPPVYRCNGTRLLSGTTGVISSPNYPQNYGPNSDCSWQVTAPPGARFVVLQFESFDTEGCPYDYVEIRNGNSSTSPLLIKLCGYNRYTFRVVSNGTSMFVRFRSDGNGNYKGFRAVYTVAIRKTEGKPQYIMYKPFVNALKGSDVVLSCESFADPVPNSAWINDKTNLSIERYSISTALIPGTNRVATHITIRNVSVYDIGYYKCRFWNFHGTIEGRIQLDVVEGCNGTRLLTGPTGVISSPNYPRDYPSNSDCSWQVTAPAGARFVVLQFESFDTEGCSYDYVEIRNGNSSTSPLLIKLCGHNGYTFRVVSNGTSMFVRFRSDGNGNYKGFRAVYTVAIRKTEAKPQYIMYKPFVNALKESDVVLSCESSADPVPNVTWINDKTNLSSGRYSISTALIPGTNRVATHITFRNVSVYDMGYYKCRFWNYHGTIEESIQLDVVEGCSEVVFDFEDGADSLKDWGRTGTAFKNQPTYGDNVNIRLPGNISNHQGDYWIGGYENRTDVSSPAGSTSGDSPQGTLISPEFQITGDNVSFLIGGGNDSSNGAVQLLVGGRIVRWSSGNRHEKMTRKTWNVQQYVGWRARLRLIDGSSDSWGHINFDDFRGDVIMCGGCSQPLGMTNGRIPDFALTASSMSHPLHGPQYGRLYTLRRDGLHVGGWTPRQNVIGEWLQVDLGTVVMVTKIATQGARWYWRWVKQYTFEYSENGTDFEQYENNEVLTGNSDSDTIVENFFSPPIRGRFIRIYPRSWENNISLRMELYGCPPKPAFPKIFGLPNIVTKLEESTVSLVCTAKGFPYIHYKWVRREPSNNLARTIIGPSLVLTKLTDSDNGVYACVASNAIGNDSFDVRLNVHTFPSLIRRMIKSQVIVTGKVTNLTCHGKGNPRPTIAWLKNGQKIDKSSRVTISSSASEDKLVTSELVITDTKYEDGGVYTCVIDNTVGATNSGGTLLVHGLPEFILTSKDLTIIKGENANLPCAATAIPTPQIRWKLNGEYLHDEEVTQNGSLMIKDAGNNQLYEGNYTCEASNYVGTKSSTAKLTVHVLPSLIRGMIKSQIIVTGKVTHLICQVKGNPRPNIAWLKNGQKITKRSRVTLSSSSYGDTLVTSELVITYTKYEDSGVYTCVFDNTLGATNSSGTLLVHGLPEFTLTPKTRTILKGQNANLSCASTAVPTPQIRWKLNGEYLHDTEVTQNGTLMIKNAANNQLYEGTYTCEASNSVGSKTSTAQLTIHDVLVAGDKSGRESVETSVVTFLIVLIAILVVVVGIVTCLNVQYKKKNVFSKRDTTGLVTYDTQRNEYLLRDYFEGW